jgi:hypothetical protein
VKIDALVEGFIDEHLIPLENMGTNNLSNRALYRKPCATAKTKAEASLRAKAKRIEAREEGTRRIRKPIPKAINGWPPKGTQKLQSRGFDKSRSMGGKDV